MKKNKFERIIIVLILCLGVIIPIFQFVSNRSLWLDEAYLSLNIINKGYFELFKPLDLKQVAPILFLQIEKLFSELIPKSEFGLRIFPLICYLFSLLFFYKIITFIHKNYYSIIFTLSLFVFNITLIYYSSEVKQYMTDVLVLTIIYYSVLKTHKTINHKYIALGIIGSISIFFSNVAPIILFTAGLYVLSKIKFNNRKTFFYLIITSLTWASTFFLYYIFFVHNHPSRDGMIEEWTYYKAFMPYNPLKQEFFNFLYSKWHMITNSIFKYGELGGYLLTSLISIGIINLIWKKSRGVLILALTPLLLHLFLSSLKLYPFDKRLILYTTPCVIILCSYGFNYIIDVLLPKLKIKKLRWIAIFVPITMFAFIYAKGFPIKDTEIKDSISYIAKNMHEEDGVYINYLSRIPFQYYHEISFVEINRKDITIGKENLVWNGKRWTVDFEAYSEELNALKGRFWFLFTKVGNEEEKKSYLIDYCKQKNKNIIQEFHANGSSVYLCDF